MDLRRPWTHPVRLALVLAGLYAFAFQGFASALAPAIHVAGYGVSELCAPVSGGPDRPAPVNHEPCCLAACRLQASTDAVAPPGAPTPVIVRKVAFAATHFPSAPPERAVSSTTLPQARAPPLG